MSIPQATIVDPQAISAARYGVKADGRRILVTSASDLTVTGTGFTTGDVGKLVFIEGAGTRTTVTDGVTDITTTPKTTRFTSATASFVAADVGSVIRLPGAGAAGVELVTMIMAVVDSHTIRLRDAPSASLTSIAASWARYHSTTITAATTTTLTLTAAITTTPVALTGEASPAILYGTDNAAAITSFNAYVGGLITYPASPLPSNNRRLSARIEYPSGMILTTATNLWPSTGSTRLNGVTITGAGNGSTIIVFCPAATGKYLFEDGTSSDATKNRVYLRGFEFVGLGHNVPNFWHSSASGAQQLHVFENIEWAGTWGDIYKLEGADTNDKWLWTGCALTAKHFGNFMNDSGSQQNLHFSWIGGMAEWNVGNMWNMTAGGDIAMTSPGSLVIVDKGVLFTLSDTDPAPPTYRVACSSVRFERRQPGVMWFDCSWRSGSIILTNCTDGAPVSSAAGLVGGTTPTDRGAIFRMGQTRGPIVTWDNCVLKGQHEYTYDSGGGSYQYRKIVQYRNCEFSDWDEPASFTVTTKTDAGTTIGGVPVIRFRNCRFSLLLTNQRFYAVDDDVNLERAGSSAADQKTWQFGNASGLWPTGGVSFDVWLPLNRTLRKVVAFLPPDATRNIAAGATWTLKTNEGSPTTLITLQPESNNMQNGLDVTGEVRMLLDTDTKRHLTFASNASVNQEVNGRLTVMYE